jgi:hypothetical protein
MSPVLIKWSTIALAVAAAMALTSVQLRSAPVAEWRA